MVEGVKESPPERGHRGRLISRWDRRRGIGLPPHPSENLCVEQRGVAGVRQSAMRHAVKMEAQHRDRAVETGHLLQEEQALEQWSEVDHMTDRHTKSVPVTRRRDETRVVTPGAAQRSGR